MIINFKKGMFLGPPHDTNDSQARAGSQALTGTGVFSRHIMMVIHAVKPRQCEPGKKLPMHDKLIIVGFGRLP